jgi:hypothetical protein
VVGSAVVVVGLENSRYLKLSLFEEKDIENIQTIYAQNKKDPSQATLGCGPGALGRGGLEARFGRRAIGALARRVCALWARVAWGRRRSRLRGLLL